MMDNLMELAETLKRTVHLARTYAKGTGSIFEDAMRDAERIADKALIECMRAAAPLQAIEGSEDAAKVGYGEQAGDDA